MQEVSALFGGSKGSAVSSGPASVNTSAVAPASIEPSASVSASVDTLPTFHFDGGGGGGAESKAEPAAPEPVPLAASSAAASTAIPSRSEEAPPAARESIFFEYDERGRQRMALGLAYKVCRAATVHFGHSL